MFYGLRTYKWSFQFQTLFILYKVQHMSLYSFVLIRRLFHFQYLLYNRWEKGNITSWKKVGSNAPEWMCSSSTYEYREWKWSKKAEKDRCSNTKGWLSCKVVEERQLFWVMTHISIIIEAPVEMYLLKQSKDTNLSNMKFIDVWEGFEVSSVYASCGNESVKININYGKIRVGTTTSWWCWSEISTT